MHHGKWTSEEEAYVEVLTEAFKAGIVPIPEGATLRVFLASMLNCPTKRISKKFVGTNYHGKRAYVRKRVGEYDPEVAKGIRERLREMEGRFIKSLKPQKRTPQRPLQKEEPAETKRVFEARSEDPTDMLRSPLGARPQGHSQRVKISLAVPAAKPAVTGTVGQATNTPLLGRFEECLRAAMENLRTKPAPATTAATLFTKTSNEPATGTSTNDFILAMLNQRLPPPTASLQTLDAATGPSSKAFTNSLFRSLQLQQKLGNTTAQLKAAMGPPTMPKN
ncbi:expressed unknown protein [Seminavis robusta]|uniref:Uncharacterized protein n=1 Tax=Seminavis robusta TaxID=568900 RepID=A0A9N8E4N4_9STRA|nr:expressed unknown protein [Seminavis robusta]|eukprot:Sro663_g183510.1 n/a (278) ;mRNA; f:27588-28421